MPRGKASNGAVMVTVELGWTYGVTGPDGQIRYVGPGRVTLSLDEATALGGDMATRVYHYEGKRYTAETLASAPEGLLRLLRERGVKAPEVAQGSVAPSPLPLTAIDGVGPETAAALRDAGYASAAAVAEASAEALAEAVAGVGAKTARRLVEAAGQAIADASAEG